MSEAKDADVDRLRAIAAKIIADYKEHYDFPWQGESHMEDCIMAALQSLSQEAVRDEALEEAYLAGFNASGEGYNGEYPFGDNNENPADDEGWRKHRDEAIAKALKREPNAAGQTQVAETGDSSVRVSMSAPAAPVAEMVRELTAQRIADGANETGLLGRAAALLAKIGQGWIPVSERLPDTTREVELAVRGRDGEIYRASGYFRNDWRTSVYDPGGTVIAWHDLMPLPPAPGSLR